MISTNEIKLKIPGKLILQGEHAAVYNKLAIAATLDKYIYIEICQIKDNLQVIVLDIFEFNDLSLNVTNLHMINLELSFFMTDSEKFLTNNLKLNGKSVYNNIDLTLKLALQILLYLYANIVTKTGSNDKLGFNLRVQSDLPIGMGLGSSGSYCVGLAAAFLIFSDIISLSNFYTKLDIVNYWAFQAELLAHGKPSGLDNTTSCYGGIVCAQNQTMHSIRIANETQPIRLLCINSNVKRRTANIINSVFQLKNMFPNIFNHIMECIEEIGQNYLRLLQIPTFICESKAQNCSKTSYELPFSITTESYVSPKISLEIYNKLSILMEMNHDLLNALGVGHPSLEHIRSITKAANYSFFKNLQNFQNPMSRFNMSIAKQFNSHNETGSSLRNNSELISIHQQLTPRPKLTGAGDCSLKIDSINSIHQKWILRPKLTGAGGGGFMIALLPHPQNENESFQLTNLVQHVQMELLKQGGYESFVAEIGCPGVQII